MNRSEFIDPQADLRRQLREFWKRNPGLLDPLRRMVRDPALRPRLKPPLPLPGFEGLKCGARTRKGTPCRISMIWPNGRCRLHGGLSTGPIGSIKTP